MTSGPRRWRRGARTRSARHRTGTSARFAGQALLGCYGIPLADSIGVVSEDAAAAAAQRFGGLVTFRADVPGLLRTSDAGDVLTDLHGRTRLGAGSASCEGPSAAD